MKPQTALRVAAILGFLGVALGAFGAHGLEQVFEANGRRSTWETAVLYHLVHSAVLLALAQRDLVARLSFALFTVGITIFSGSLYILALTNVKWLGAITPLGGLAMLAGWVAVAFRR